MAAQAAVKPGSGDLGAQALARHRQQIIQRATTGPWTYTTIASWPGLTVGCWRCASRMCKRRPVVSIRAPLPFVCRSLARSLHSGAPPRHPLDTRRDLRPHARISMRTHPDQATSWPPPAPKLPHAQASPGTERGLCDHTMIGDGSTYCSGGSKQRIT